MFWKLNPKKIKPFIEAFKQKQEYETEQYKNQANFSAWLNGVYFARAIATNFSKNTQYFDQPIELNDNKDKELQENLDSIKFETWVNNFNKNFK